MCRSLDFRGEFWRDCQTVRNRWELTKAQFATHALDRPEDEQKKVLAYLSKADSAMRAAYKLLFEV